MSKFEIFLSYFTGLIAFETTVWLVAFKEFNWIWILVGLFVMFLFVGFSKIKTTEYTSEGKPVIKNDKTS